MTADQDFAGAAGASNTPATLVATETLAVTAGPTTVTFNASSGGLLSVKRTSTSSSSSSDVVEFLSSATAGEEPLFTLGLTRLSDHGGPYHMMANEFRKVMRVKSTQ